MRKNNHFQAVFKNAPDLAYQVTAGIEHLKCVPVLLTGLYCLSQTYKGEHIKDDIIESLESFAEMQKVFISQLSENTSLLHDIVDELNDVFAKTEEVE
ncbi:hypothetical protein ROV36_03945 [Pasteurella multocida]|uniref:Uncharacterized protein n=1 Tax=Pasteurella multocida TaxID=747 RepID=A0A2Z4Q086_PASMD|nr:hypothetical protein [Pasteurella multocida]EGP02983.1 hypothetical protein AAUPMG_11946 [Pasteurella multocida subsp. multocida str. Anand1_goat]AWY03352.1 hypothetical protein [Pasteurella multocida]MEB3451342.1 hypothetical protein [Pasteurella multocida]MEB3453688.1 hypothetical protein [Pasteurella multocida]MEB3455837.1 hypothetical protein [Pasteurella multocida]